MRLNEVPLFLTGERENELALNVVRDSASDIRILLVSPVD